MGNSQSQSEFRNAAALLASVNHDLRTPLNATLGMIELALGEPLPSAVEDYLLTAYDSARALATNLDRMLELARYEVAHVATVTVPIDLHRLANEVVARLPNAGRANIDIRVGRNVQAPLYGDEWRLRNALSTLLDHAVCWLGHPRILLEVTVGTTAEITQEVKIGISERGLAGLERSVDLVPYDLTENLRSGRPGLLALAAASRWLEEMHGRLLTDAGNCGRFFVEIPLARNPPSGASANDSLAAESFALRAQMQIAGRNVAPLDVLVVDDTIANQKVVKAMLTKRGHRVRVAGNGKQALDQIRRDKFDVVLMDAQMPLMNGFEATAAIRRLPEPSRSHVPIIAMTAHTLQEDRMKCLAAGMDDYLAKPIDMATLVNHVEFYGHGMPLRKQSGAGVPADRSASHPPERDFLAAARARLAGDEALLLELIRLFNHEAASLLETIATGLRTKDWELVVRAAHNLRGLAANFDDLDTTAAATAVEASALASDFERCEDRFRDLTAACACLVDLLSRYEADASGGG